MPQYRKGLSSARSFEREWLLYLEKLGRNLASQSLYEERAVDPSVDDSAVGAFRIRASTVSWFRAQRRLFVFVRILFDGGMGFRSYRWRTPTLPASLPSGAIGPGVPLTLGVRAATLRRRAGVRGGYGRREGFVVCDAGGGTAAKPLTLVFQRRLCRV
jgi:hypothetical protein